MQNETTIATRSAQAAAQELVPRLAAGEREHDLAGRFGGDSLALAAAEGLLGINVPEGYGEGLGGTLETLRTIAHGSPSTALMLAMHTSVLSHWLLDPAHVPAAHRPRFLEQRDWAFGEALAGRMFGVANSEAGAGGDVKQSRAEVREGRLFGTKSFCSMGTAAHYHMAAARDTNGAVDYYVVAGEPETTHVASPWNAMGMRSSESVSLRFEGARVLGPLAYPGIIDGANNRHWSTLSFTAIFIGIAESLLDDVATEKSGILQRSGAVDLHLTLQACRSFLRHCVATERTPTDGAYRKLVRDCKLYVTRSLAQQASNVYIAQGGSAYRFESTISRKLRDLLAGPALRPPVGVSFDELWEELV